ncbi:hypothetical protein [Salinisphaera aquimarina]|uniref:Phosphodiesterase n=1 Tax=Salinisphaera aquimarina TaxID=2094031 RepID=A0ABV7ERG7_9GAMM
MRMRTYPLALVQLAGLIFISCGYAQSDDYGASDEVTHGTVLEMPAAHAPAQAAAPAPETAPDAAPRTPPRGMTMNHVLAGYGPPVTRHTPVGDPPITRWDYPGYRLYFEFDHVLHAVIPDDPEAIAHADELTGSDP